MIVFLLALPLLLAAPTSSYAFSSDWSNYFTGFHNFCCEPNHENITAQGIALAGAPNTYGGLNPLDLNALTRDVVYPDLRDWLGDSGGFTVPSLTRVGNYNASTDSVHHFDNSAIEGGKQYVQSQWNTIFNDMARFEQIRSNLGVLLGADELNRLRTDMVARFGYILHADQDFYSHSNWDGSNLVSVGVSTPIVNDRGEIIALVCASNTTCPTNLPPSSFPLWPGTLLGPDGLPLFSGCYPESTCPPGVLTHDQVNKDASTTIRGRITYGGTRFTLFDASFNLAVRQTAADFTFFDQIFNPDPISGNDIINDLNTDPSWLAYLQSQQNNFNPADIGSWQQLNLPPLDVPVPEPSTWLLLGSGLVGLILWRKRTA